MPTRSESQSSRGSARPVLLLDTSAAIASVLTTHVHHQVVLTAIGGSRIGLAGHAMFETYSVLTRLPSPQRLSAELAARVIRTNFPHSAHLDLERSSALPTEFAAVGIAGGAVYDGLVGACAVAAGATLLTCDRQAMASYAALGVDVLQVG